MTRKSKTLLGILILIAGALVVRLWPASKPQTVILSSTDLKPLGRVSDRYLSYNIEMVDVTGGRFWKPYGPGGSVQKGDDRYAYRPPLDLTNPRLIKLAVALAPSYVRYSGTWANATAYVDSDTVPTNTPPGYDAVLTRKEWHNAIEFARAADAAIVTSFATSAGTRDPDGHWQPHMAEEWLRATQQMGGSIAATEFANEPNYISLTKPPVDYKPADYRRDYAVFANWLRKASPNTLLLAPGTAELAQPLRFLARHSPGRKVFDRDDLIAKDSPKPDYISFHYYGGASKRCSVPLIGTNEKDALSESWLNRIDEAVKFTEKLRTRIGSVAPMWITETAQSACGGDPWASTSVDGFRFMDQVARLARQGVEVYTHNTLSAGDYALLDEHSFTPRPNYWLAYLWKQFMGTQVLDAGAGTTGLHVYSHCLRGQPGGVAVLAINLDRASARELQLDHPGILYSATPDPHVSTVLLLNGQPMRLGDDDTIPNLSGTPVPMGKVRLAPASINFIRIDTAANRSCSVGNAH